MNSSKRPVYWLVVFSIIKKRRQDIAIFQLDDSESDPTKAATSGKTTTSVVFQVDLEETFMCKKYVLPMVVFLSCLLPAVNAAVVFTDAGFEGGAFADVGDAFSEADRATFD